MFPWYGVPCHLYYFLSMVRLFLFHLTSYHVESGEFSVRGYAFSGHTCQSVQKTAVKMSDLFIYFLLWSSLLKVGIKICTANFFFFNLWVTIFKNLQIVALLTESILTCWLTAAESRIWNKFKSLHKNKLVKSILSNLLPDCNTSGVLAPEELFKNLRSQGYD